jgi:hypothetical protein
LHAGALTLLAFALRIFEAERDMLSIASVTLTKKDMTYGLDWTGMDGMHLRWWIHPHSGIIGLMMTLPSF